MSSIPKMNGRAAFGGVRVRFAPSPTGFLHVGGARTALFNWLYARRHGGTFVLRIEDTDAARNTDEAVDVIYQGLSWLGIDWDEGGAEGGPHEPYFQSQRGKIYEKHLARLMDSGRAYEDGGAIRLRASRGVITVPDLVCGDVTFDVTSPETHPDMTIRRPDGSWIFHFASVVDDLEMGITHVIRGEDHLSNTPRHIDLYRALGAEPPAFAHIPLLLNPDGSKMSKRDAGASVQTYIEEGYCPEAVRNYLCLLGWSPKDNREKLDISEVVERFDLAHVSRGNASFDMDKLLWLQGEYARELDGQRLLDTALPALRKAGVPVDDFPPDYTRAAIATCKGKFKLPGELAAYAGFYFTDRVTILPEDAAQVLTSEGQALLAGMRKALADAPTFGAEQVELTLREFAADHNVKMKVIVHPLRLACTGSRSGPSLYHLIEVLGRQRTLERIDAALTAYRQG